MNDIVVLLSGGIDSTVLAARALHHGRLAAALFVDYGQPAWLQEKTAAREWCLANRVRFEACTMVLAGTPLAAGVGQPGPRVVAGRNLGLLAMASNFAASVAGIREIWYGATQDDQASYPDCRPDFIYYLNYVLRLSEAGHQVVAPLIGATRSQVLELAAEFGVDVTRTWSCYEPTADGWPCGSCDACRRRM